MLLFLILLAITISSLWFSHWYEEKHRYSTSPLPFVGLILGVLGVFAVIIMLICSIIDHSIAQEAYATKMAEYEGLVYIVENIEEDYLDDFDIRKADVVNKILEWNVNITSKKVLCDNLWVGMMYPDYWKDIPTIDYSLLNGG